MKTELKPISRRTFLVAAAAGTTLAATLGGRALAQSQVKVIKISARKFVFTPAMIKLKAGETVELELATEDVLMGFSIPALKMRTDLVPGQKHKLRLTPDKPGELDFLCDIFCGSGHEDMNGKFVVEA
jgi:cytochrome c oxidase subunit 2